jgi:hypothetical protein
MNKDDDEDTPMLVLEFHEGEYLVPESKTKLLLEIAGSAVRPEGPSFDTLEEAAAVLEYWCEKYASPVATSGNLIVFIGRETGNNNNIEPVARLDIIIEAGTARATVKRNNFPSEDIRPTQIDEDDGVAALVSKVLLAHRELR